MYGYVAPQQDRMAEAHDHSANMATASDPPTVAPSHLDSASNRFTRHKKSHEDSESGIAIRGFQRKNQTF